MNQISPRPKFDSNRAWQDAVALIRANSDLLLALAGAFIVLPAFAIAVLLPAPEPNTAANFEAVAASLGEYYEANAPALILSALVHMIGTLAMLTLFTDASRPTVGQAIKQAFVRMPTVIFAQLILGMAIGAMLLVSVMLGAMLGNTALSIIGAAVGAGLGIWAMVRLSLIPPSVIVEGMSNPIKAITRSWQLTEGNAGRLLLFYMLLGIIFIVVSALASGLVAALLGLLVGGETAKLGGLLVATCIQAVTTVCFTAVGAASYRQFAGSDDLAQPFN